MKHSEPVLNESEIRANLRDASFRAWCDAVPEVARRERFRLVLAVHGRVDDNLEQVLDELLDAV